MSQELPVTSLKMFGKTVKVRFVPIVEHGAITCCGLYLPSQSLIMISKTEHEADPQELLKTLVHEVFHAFANESGLCHFLDNDNSKEEKICSDIENHLWPVFRAIARLEAGAELDANDKQVLRTRKPPATGPRASRKAPKRDSVEGDAPVAD